MDGVMQIITGRERRRRWSVRDKLRIVDELAEPGARVDVVQPGSDDKAVDGGGTLTAAIGSGEQPWPAANGDYSIKISVSASALNTLQNRQLGQNSGLEACLLLVLPKAAASLFTAANLRSLILRLFRCV